MAQRLVTASSDPVADDPRNAGSRAAWGTISREQVVSVAADLVATGGYERFTIRSLAAHLGIAPMSLYRHVRNKDDLLDEIVGQLLAVRWRPDIGDKDWRAWTAAAADRFRDFLVTQPAALHVYLRRPVTTPAAIDRMDAMLRVLRTVAVAEHDARGAYAAIQTYTIGFAALEASRDRQHADPSPSDVSDLAHDLAAYTTPRQFAAGLDLLLDGISGRASTAGRRRRRT